ncbi:lyase family protein [Leifsonia shinshuensis]
MAEPFDWGLLEPAGAVGVPAGDDRVLAALVRVEEALAGAWDELDGTAARPGYAALAFDPDAIDRERLTAGAREAGVPVIALVAQLRAQAGAEAERVHRGATSQDVVDSALMLVSRDALSRARDALTAAAAELAARAAASRSTPLLVRTLSQPAEPSTLGAFVGSWLDAVVSALETLDRIDFPLQLGGAVGTGAAFARLAARSDAPRDLRAALAARLGLTDPGRAWHTERTPVLAVADGAARVAAAAGRIGRDLALAARDGVLLPATGGGSSAMPHKKNPVDAVLLTANGLRAPGLLATVHTAALSSDARPAGEWHAEWQAWRGLLRIAVESAELLAHAVGDLVVAEDAGTGVDADAVDLAAAGDVADAAVARYRARTAQDKDASEARDDREVIP